MVVNKQTELGKINIKSNAVVSIVADAAIDCYGVVGICSKDEPYRILKRDSFEKGISVKEEKTGYDITINIVIALGVKVTEILRSVQKKIKYVVENTLEISVGKVNVYVQDLKKVE